MSCVWVYIWHLNGIYREKLNNMLPDAKIPLTDRSNRSPLCCPGMQQQTGPINANDQGLLPPTQNTLINRGQLAGSEEMFFHGWCIVQEREYDVKECH